MAVSSTITKTGKIKKSKSCSSKKNKDGSVTVVCPTKASLKKKVAAVKQEMKGKPAKKGKKAAKKGGAKKGKKSSKKGKKSSKKGK